MNNTDIATGLLGLAIAFCGWLRARTFPLQSLENGLGAGFFPLLVIGAIVLLSLTSIAVGLRKGSGGTPLTFVMSGTPQAMIVLLALVAFILAFGQFGLLFPGVVLIVGLMLVLGTPLISATLIGSASGGAVYVLFANILRMPMP